MRIKETSKGKMHISCTRCNLEDTCEYNVNPDEVFLEFLCKYDEDNKKVTTYTTNIEIMDKVSDNNEYDSHKNNHKNDVKLDNNLTSTTSSTTKTVVATATTQTESTNKNNTNSDNSISNIVRDENSVRSESEIDKMIGDEKPDKLTRSVLYSKTDYLADYRVIREIEPKYGPNTDKLKLDKRLVKELKKNGINRLYKFQHIAIKNIIAGNDTIIEAPTASGKTEAFLVPIIQRIIDSENARGDNQDMYTKYDDDNDNQYNENDKGNGDKNTKNKSINKRQHVHAIFVYPTKALAKDQLPKIQNMAKAVNLSADVLDGDTDRQTRNKILNNPPHILVTNFDLLHHQMWRQTNLSKILRTFRFLVVDEVHTYTGIFGSNVHYVIKRLARIAGSNNFEKNVQYIAASATLVNAENFCTKLFDINKITHVRGSGPSRHIEFAMVFPILRRPRRLMVDLTKKFATSGHQTMTFSNSHRGSELVAIYSQRAGVNINVHRAGLTPKQRSATEKKFKDGKLQAISCTPTLELGIDVGRTDCVVSAPTPINRLIQRIGRAARSGKRHGYAFLVLGDDPISQYYKNHATDYFEDTEQLYIDPHNPYVEECQILAMAHDAPIKCDEMIQQHADTIKQLIMRGELKKRYDKTIVPNIHTSNSQTLVNYNIRGMGESIDIVYNGTKVGDRVCPIALEELHKGAVYFLAGRSYIVTSFDYPNRQHAIIEPLSNNHPYYTKALTTEYPSIEEIIEKRMVNGIETAFCKLRIEKNVSKYAKIKWGDSYSGMQKYDENVTTDSLADDDDDDDISSSNIVKLDEPLLYTYVTKGIVFCAPRPVDEIQKAKTKMNNQSQYQEKTVTATTTIQSPELTQKDQFINKLDEDYITTSGYHATEHVVIEGSNMITGGASQNLGGISMGTSGIIFVHDGVIGGSGASRALYDRLELAFKRSMHIVDECPCKAESGCPRCIMSYRCGNNNEYLHKMSSLEVLKRINNGERTSLALDSLEYQKPIV